MPGRPIAEQHWPTTPHLPAVELPGQATIPSRAPVTPRRLAGLPRRAWWLVPALAVTAYAPVLALWFALDDFILLDYNKFLRWPSALFQFGAGSLFYRPLSITLIWNAGEALFGANALPYHLISLGLHALAALLLGRAVTVIADDGRVGWLAGGLFAVYPLNTEAVGWLAAQWDLWAAVCGLAALWGFAQGWRNHDSRAYGLGLGAMVLAVGMKESILLLPVLLPLAAVVATCTCTTGERPQDRQGWMALGRRAVTWSLPYAVPTLAFVALRVSAGGRVGGYPGQRTDYPAFFWDSLTAAGQELVMPLNRSVFAAPLIQFGGFLVAAGLLVGVALWARHRGPILLLAGAWILIFLAPVLNLIPPTNPEHLGNRLYYMASMGYCLALAGLAAGALARISPRWTTKAALAALLLMIPVTWVQLGPWVQSARQERTLLAQIAEIMVPNAQQVQVNVQGLPDWYQGAYLFGGGLNPALNRFTRQKTHVTLVTALDPNQLNTRFVWPGPGGVYNMAITLDPTRQLYEVNQLDGVTTGAAPPDGGRIWNYTECAQETPPGWQPIDARFRCAADAHDPLPGAASYAVFTPQTADGQLRLPDTALDLHDQRLLRLAVCLRLPTLGAGRRADWFWNTGAGTDWSAEQSRGVLLQSNVSWRVYWTYLPIAQLDPHIQSLRFDPVNTTDEVDIAWIAVTPFP